MHPTFKDKEYLLTEKVSYRFNEPKRGDIVVFKAPPDDKEEFIKRIIGLPGDQVMVKGGKVYVNGKILGESSYLASDIVTIAGEYLAEGNPVTVKENEYILMGDNRPHSFDSRNFGPIRKTKIVGRAWFRYWPISEVSVVKKPIYNF